MFCGRKCMNARPHTNHGIQFSLIVFLRNKSLSLIRKDKKQDLEASEVRFRNCLHQVSLSKPIPVFKAPSSNLTGLLLLGALTVYELLNPRFNEGGLRNESRRLGGITVSEAPVSLSSLSKPDKWLRSVNSCLLKAVWMGKSTYHLNY